MKTNPHSLSTKALCIWTSALCGAGALCGCSGSKISEPRSENPQRVQIADFIDNSAPPADTHPNTTQIQADDTPINSPDLGQDITLTTSVPTSSFEPSSPGTLALVIPSGSLELLDAKVGDVNGKPIFTNSFFAPIEDRLIAEASRLSPSQWSHSAGQAIVNRLDGIIADELLRAEALTALTPTQRVGLQAFLNNFRNDILSNNLGSSQLASRRIEQEEGVTLDQALKQKEIDTLVQLTLIQEVNRRVNVSWRDIKQRYERDIDQFSPPPTAIFRVIRTFADNTDKVNEIQSQLDSGTDFLKIAAGDLNSYKTEADGMHSFAIENTYETTDFFGPAELLNEHAQKLAIGESVGPLELGTNIYWIKLMDIDQETISLYDAQLQIQRDLTFERRKEARDRYLDRLMERARVSSRDEVLVRLLEIARERYGPRG